MAKLSRSSAELIRDFFREHLANPSFELPRVEIATGRLAGFAVRILRIHGITIGPLVFIDPSLLVRARGRPTLPRDLVVHEIAHVVQYREFGFFGFLGRYFAGYFATLRQQRSLTSKARHAAYLAISLEIEARQTAREFERWFAERVK